MAVIRANRESIDDRFNVLGFTVRSELPLFEIAIATDPELLKPELRAKRNPGNFHTSRLLRALPSQRGEAVYLVPPEVVSRFVGQPRLYFGLATYRESDRSTPVSTRMPDRGTMYVSLSGLTERGLRRSVRSRVVPGGPGYGGNGTELAWGGDAAGSAPPPSRDEDRPVPQAKSPAATGEPSTYSDGYSEDLWKQPAPQPATAPQPVAATPAASPTPNGAAAQSLAMRPVARRPSPTARPLLVSSYYKPDNFWDALSTQARFFIDSARWYLGVDDTTVMPHSAICQVRTISGSTDRQSATAFFIGPRLLLTAAHVLYGKSDVLIVPGKNGDGTGGANEPFGRFRVTDANWTLHPSYGSNHDFDLAVICVPPAHAAPAGRFFDIVEELTQSRSEGVVVTGYAAWWTANTPIEKYVNENIDPNKQHMMGGYIRSLPSDDTFDYDLQTLGGTSGSPVYWIEEGARPRAHVVGVHVDEFSETTNLGCRLTPAKIAWIRGEAARWGLTVPFSLGLARSLSSDEDSAHDIGGPIPDDVASAAQALGGARGLTLTAPEYPMASRFEPAASGNYRSVTGTRTIDKIVIHITDGGANINGTISWFKNPAAKVSAHYVIGQDGEVVQMVAHNDVAWHAGSANGTSIGIEHVANTRGLNPTAAQMCASAALVTWLCDQYGIDPDRSHILGHAEADGKTTHSACPNAVWDWVYYMDMIATRTCYEPEAIVPRTQSLALGGSRPLQARHGHDHGDDHMHPHSHGLGDDEPVDHGAQSLGVRPPYAAAQEVITPYYDPSDPASALTCQADAFSQAREEWFAGVPNTTIFPHSAICLLEMKDAAGKVLSRGTGFYIGPNRILTCGHNLAPAERASVDVIPGKNGQGAGTEPFGRFNVPRGSWRVPGSYSGPNTAFDLAVIDDVPVAAPGGQWFDVLEELNESRPEGVVVCGYSSRSTKLPQLTAAIDGFKQHLHAGYIAALGPGDSTFDYPILSLKRASGSPVYYISSKDGALRSYVVGVHTGSATEDMNRGCRLTGAKIDWIEGRTTSLSLGLRARSLGADDASDLAVPLIPQPNKTACWAAAMAMLLAHRRQQSRTPESIVDELGAGLASSYGWDLIDAVKSRYGFEAIPQPSDTSLYHTPRQWARWLNALGPLWVVIVGAPHAVVVAGIRGSLDDPAKTEVKVLNPWDLRVSFDNDPVEFHPANSGHEAWLPFETFASDFGNMAEPGYGNWRILHLPATPARAQGLASNEPANVDDPNRIRLLPPPPPVVRDLSASRALEAGTAVAIASTIAGAVMERLANNEGDITWELDQLRGYKHPNDIAPSPMPPSSDATPIRLTGWPSVEVGFLVTDEISAGFEINWQYNGRSVGNVLISNIATNDAVGMGLVVKAKIMDDNIVYPRDKPTFAALRIRFEYRFTHYVLGDKIAIRDIRLFGDGTYSDSGRWEQT